MVFQEFAPKKVFSNTILLKCYIFYSFYLKWCAKNAYDNVSDGQIGDKIIGNVAHAFVIEYGDYNE